jgi:hypothetical protein
MRSPILPCNARLSHLQFYTDVIFTGKANDVTAALNESKCDLYSVFSFRYRINPTIKHQQNKLSIPFPIFVREVYLIAVASSFCVVRCGDPTQNSRTYHLRCWMHSESDVTAKCGNSRYIAIIQNHREDPPQQSYITKTCQMDNSITT